MKALCDNVIYELLDVESSTIIIMTKAEDVYGKVTSVGPRVTSKIKVGDIIITDDMTKDLSTGKIDRRLRVIKEASIIAILE